MFKHDYQESVCVFAEGVRSVLSTFVPHQAVRCIYFHFPDPWWKRHH
ncbi:hypothetical protein [Pajaroellobacter abortibovis]